MINGQVKDLLTSLFLSTTVKRKIWGKEIILSFYRSQSKSMWWSLLMIDTDTRLDRAKKNRTPTNDTECRERT